jgi:hypothetical protein
VVVNSRQTQTITRSHNTPPLTAGLLIANMSSLPTFNVQLPQVDCDDSSPASSMDWSSSAVPYYSMSILSTTTTGTTHIYGWPLSPSTPTAFASTYNPYSIHPAFPPVSVTWTPYQNYFPTTAPFRMPSSSSIPTVRCANPIDIVGTVGPYPDFGLTLNTMLACASTGFAGPASSVDSLGTHKDKNGSSPGGSGTCSNGSKLHSSSFLDPGVPPKSSRMAPVELPVMEEALAKVKSSKRSRTAHACERCRIRKARVSSTGILTLS